jgi:hypothetical protein
MSAQTRQAIVLVALSFLAWMGGNAVLSAMAKEPMAIRLFLSFVIYLFVLLFAVGVYVVRNVSHSVAPTSAAGRWGVITVSCAVFGAAAGWALQFLPIANLNDLAQWAFGGLVALVAMIAVALLDWLETPVKPAPQREEER